MKKAKFDAKRAPPRQVALRVNDISKHVLQLAGGDVRRVNTGMVRAAAQKTGLPFEELAAHLRRLGASV